MSRVEGDRSVCAGSGNCVRIAPDLFDQDDDEGLVVVLQPEPPPERDRAARQAENNCPTGAIKVTD
ncbi:hypothetical protein Acor_73180 [Acrocarpospora corrugata]|uniref:Ferredoxin n=1 Tax=Acrocarpospora corrugata TaxID=35763 RepID=A0A5M3WAH8_9ACTN|nr:ferredoxin [Acrocarpospora corrugata]GES05250.1 hypothetical protein Acor_73180 [Acrocarpospora corrugata]